MLKSLTHNSHYQVDFSKLSNAKQYQNTRSISLQSFYKQVNITQKTSMSRAMNKAFLLIDECHYYFKFSIALLKSANSCKVSVSPRRLGSMPASANERVNQSLVASSFP